MTISIAIFASGAALGVLVGWLLSRSSASAAQARAEELRRQVEAASQGFDGIRRSLQESEESRARAQERVEMLEQRLAQERELVAKTQETSKDAFKALASEALTQNTEHFFKVADEVFRAAKEAARSDLGSCQKDITASVADMKARIEECQRLIREFENERGQITSRMGGSIAQILDVAQSLRTETQVLRRALTSSSSVRGNLGEMILQQILEDNGLVRGIHFETQVTLPGAGQETVSRPDIVLNLPDGHHLAIDAKEIGGEYLLAQETDDPARQKEHLQNLVKNIRTNFTNLSKKEYQSTLDPETPFVLMFISNEAAARTAMTTDPSLYRDAKDKKILLTSPTTVIPLIQLIHQVWQNYQLARNAQELGLIVEELGDRISAFVGHVKNMRDGIEKTAESWDKAVGSWDRSVLPQIERARSLGGKLKEPKELLPVETKLRPIPPSRQERST